MDKVSVAEAAQLLGVSQDAIYKRIKRGTIPWDKGEDDKTYVYIDGVDRSTDRARQSTDQASSASNYVSKDELLSELRARVGFLEEELQRKDAILLSLTHRIPELEASPDPREDHVTASEAAYSTHAPPEGYGTSPREAEESLHPRSWWRRFFGFE